MTPIPLNTDTIRAQLTATTQPLLTQLDCFDRLDSTNTHLLHHAPRPTPSGTVCLAEHQTAGRGRHGHLWDSPPHAHIYCSLLWHFPTPINALSGLSPAIGIALAQALSQHGISGLGLKWPNDLYHSGRKLGGILIETDGTQNDGGNVSTRAVIGIGVNILRTQNPAWISLSDILSTDHPIDRNTIVAQLLNTLLPTLAQHTKHGFASYLTQWAQWDILAGRTISVRTPTNETHTGIAQGIDPSGALLLQTPALSGSGSGVLLLRGGRVADF